jgi:hypothetical protein
LAIPPEVVEPVEFMPVPVPDVPPIALLPVAELLLFMELLGLVFVAPMLLPVVPWFIAPLVFAPGEPPVPIVPPLAPVAAGFPDVPPPAAPGPACASAKVLVTASAPANANVESFMVISSWLRGIEEP